MKKSGRIALLSLGICSALLSSFSFTALAHKHGDGVPYEIAPNFYLEDMVITATRTPLTEKSVPMVAKVVTRSEIQHMGAINVVDALKFIPGINLNNSSDHGGHSVKLRGMDNYHTLILLDGRRIASENQKKIMNKTLLERININDVERIEVIFGNGSALYGSDAMAGVINIITRKDYHAWTETGVYTSSNQSGVNFSHSTGYTGKLRAKVSARTDRLRKKEIYNYFSPGLFNCYIHSTNSYGYKRYMDLGLDYTFDDEHGIEFDANFVKEDVRSQVKRVGYNENFFDNDNSDYSLRYYGQDGKHNYDINVYENMLHKNFTNASGSDKDKSKFEIKRLEVHDSINVNDSHILTLGGEVDRAYYMGSKIPGKDKSIETSAFYLEDQWRLGDKWLFIPAIRMDHHEIYGNEVSPKIGTTLNLSENTRFKANYGKGFRAPTIFELYSEWNPGWHPPIIGNDKLTPEKSVNYDISIEGERGKVFAKLTYFHNDVEDLIGFGAYPNDTGTSFPTKYVMENKGDYEIKGVEAEFKYNFDDNWSFSTSYNYLDAVDKQTKETLNERAKHRGQLRLTYSGNGDKPITVNLWNDWTNSYRVVDVYAGVEKNYDFNTTSIMVHKKVSKATSLYAGVDNIFDKKYEMSADSPFRMEGRTWRFGLETKMK